MLKTLSFLVISTCLGMLAACATFQVATDFDTGYDFSGLQTLAWDSTAKSADNLAVQRFRSAVGKTLADKGLRLSEDAAAAQLLLRLQVTSEIRHEVRQMPSMGVRGGWGFWGYDHDLYMHEYEQEWHVIEMLVPGQDRVVWEGKAAARVVEDLTPPERDARAAEATREILQGFPPVPQEYLHQQ